MFCDKIFLKFAIILLIFQPTYSALKHIWKSPYNESDIYCAENRIEIKFNQLVIITYGQGVAFPGSRNFVWSVFKFDYKGGISDLKYYREAMMDYLTLNENLETTSQSKRFGYYAYFNLLPEVTSLEDFFGFNFKDKIQEIDFDHFDYSKVTSFKNAFKGLVNLKSIKFKSNWKRCDSQTPPLNNKPKPKIITSMFQGCTNLISVDLSYFDTSSIEDMSLLFYGCTELRAINISNFNFIKENITQDMLLGVEKLVHIDLVNIEGCIDEITSQEKIYNNTNLNVCQDRQIIQTDNDICCDLEIVNGQIQCKPSSNFIKLYYSQNCIYENGFQGGSNNRNGKYLISYNREMIRKDKYINITEDLGGLTLIIYFYSPQKSLGKFFDINEDANMKYVISIDLSNFNGSETVNMNSMVRKQLI